MQAPGPGGIAALPLRVTALTLLVAHLLLFAWLALRPLSVLWVSPPNLQPLATIREDLRQGPQAMVRDLGSGLLTLAPLGVLLPLAVEDLRVSRLVSFLRTVFVAAMISLSVELSQSGARGHVANVDTVLLSGLGVALTHLLLYPPIRRWLRHRFVPSVPWLPSRTPRGDGCPSAGTGNPPTEPGTPEGGAPDLGVRPPERAGSVSS